jgi:hypothetical protein
MKAVLSLAVLLTSARALGDELLWIGDDVEVKCACEKDKATDSHRCRKVDQLPPDWTTITGIHPPDIKDIPLRIEQVVSSNQGAASGSMQSRTEVERG